MDKPNETSFTSLAHEPLFMEVSRPILSEGERYPTHYYPVIGIDTATLEFIILSNDRETDIPKLMTIKEFLRQWEKHTSLPPPDIDIVPMSKREHDFSPDEIADLTPEEASKLLSD